MTDNNLQKKVAELEAQVKKLKKNNLGLVFEDKAEDVVEQSKTQVPVLKEVKAKRIVSNDENPNNILIEGDNYHSLSVLNYTHKKKIDLIDLNDFDSLTPLLEREIVYDGILVYSKDEAARAHFESVAIGEWLDWEPHHRTYHDAMERELLEAYGE